MSGDVCPNDRQRLKPKAAITNGTKALFGDGRSAGARRYRDLLHEFANEAGGLASLPATGQQIVRRLAQVSVELELLESTRATGKSIDPVAFCTLVNSQRRLLRDLAGLALRMKDKPGPTLSERLARNYGAEPEPAPEAA